MKKIFSVVALLCVLVCTAAPVFADAAPGGVGRDDVLEGDFSTAETAQTGDDMADATTNSADSLKNLMNGVKNQWDVHFSGLNGVLEFLTVCVGGSIGCLPASFGFYVIMAAVCIALVAVIKEIGGKGKSQ